MIGINDVCQHSLPGKQYSSKNHNVRTGRRGPNCRASVNGWIQSCVYVSVHSICVKVMRKKRAVRGEKRGNRIVRLQGHSAVLHFEFFPEEEDDHRFWKLIIINLDKEFLGQSRHFNCVIVLNCNTDSVYN